MTTTTTLPTEEQLAARKTWAEALRSGKYDQASGVLRSMEHHYDYDTGQTVWRDADGKKKCCCLGVMCDLAPVGRWAKDAPEIFLLEGETVHEDPDAMNENWDAMPPAAVREWAGLSESEAAELARLNDGDWTFAGIADLIDNLHLITFDQLCDLDSLEDGAEQLRALAT